MQHLRETPPPPITRTEFLITASAVCIGISLLAVLAAQEANAQNSPEGAAAYALTSGLIYFYSMTTPYFSELTNREPLRGFLRSLAPLREANSLAIFRTQVVCMIANLITFNPLSEITMNILTYAALATYFTSMAHSLLIAIQGARVPVQLPRRPSCQTTERRQPHQWRLHRVTATAQPLRWSRTQSASPHSFFSAVATPTPAEVEVIGPNETKLIALDLDIKDIPETFKCPITTGVLENPMRTPLGHVFSRSPIELWLESNSSCPLTRKILQRSDLLPATDLQAQFDAFIKRKTQERNTGFSIDEHMRMCPLDCVIREGKIVHT